jgi:hypothetical protein
VGASNTCIYCAQEIDVAAVATGAWEIGIGTVSAGSPDTLIRDGLISSSTGDWSVVDPAGLRVFVVSPAAFYNSRVGFGPGVGTTRWYGPATAAAPNQNLVFPAFEIRAALIAWVVGVPITQIGIEITGVLGGGNCRLGVYEDQAGLPGRLLDDSGDVATASTGIKTHTFATPIVPTTPWLWAVYVSSVSNNQVRGRSASNNLYGGLLGWPDAARRPGRDQLGEHAGRQVRPGADQARRAAVRPLRLAPQRQARAGSARSGLGGLAVVRPPASALPVGRGGVGGRSLRLLPLHQLCRVRRSGRDAAVLRFQASHGSDPLA